MYLGQAVTYSREELMEALRAYERGAQTTRHYSIVMAFGISPSHAASGEARAWIESGGDVQGFRQHKGLVPIERETYGPPQKQTVIPAPAPPEAKPPTAPDGTPMGPNGQAPAPARAPNIGKLLPWIAAAALAFG